MIDKAPELSRPFSLEKLGSRPIIQEIEAGPAERAALAKRLDLVALDRLTARVQLQRLAPMVVAAHGELEADIVQTCVVTLEAFPSHVTDSFEVRFNTDPAMLDRVDVEIDPEEPADLEPVAGSMIDLGEIVAQFLSLALDPYPRKPDAELAVQPGFEDGQAEPQPNPFAALERLRKQS